MSLFSDPKDAERKANLAMMEDRRLTFAQKLSEQGFKPEKMLFLMTGNGGFGALCAFAGKKCLIVSPGFGEDADFTLETFEAYALRRERIDVDSQGLAGIMGLGKKGEHGVNYVFTRRDGGETVLPVVSVRGSWMECPLKKNPLLSLKRRRGNANIVWDMRPIDPQSTDKVTQIIEDYIK